MFANVLINVPVLLSTLSLLANLAKSIIRNKIIFENQFIFFYK